MRYVVLTVGFLAALAAGCLLVVAPGAAADGLFVATQDTRVVELYPNRKVGHDTVLHAKAGAGTRLESYLRFQVSGVTGTKLKLYAVESTVDAAEVTPTTGGSTWTEGRASWSNRPQPTGGDLGRT